MKIYRSKSGRAWMARSAAGTSGKTCRFEYSARIAAVSGGVRVTLWMASAAERLALFTVLKGWYWPMLLRRQVYSSCWVRQVMAMAEARSVPKCLERAWEMDAVERMVP